MPRDEFETSAISLFDARIGQTEEIRVIPFNGDPSTIGLQAPLGSLALRTDGLAHQKIGAADTDWTQGSQIGAPSTGGTIPACLPFCLASGVEEHIPLELNQVPFLLSDGTPANFDLVGC